MAELQNLSLLEDWSLSAVANDCDVRLGLVSVLCISGDLIYIYGNHPMSPGATAAQLLPQPLAELLIFEPVVPLRYTPHGFQTLLPSEWDAMSAQNDSYVGLSTWSSAHESVASDNSILNDDEPDESSSSTEDAIHEMGMSSNDEDGANDGSLSEGSRKTGKGD
uniref:Uncharacterized protein n=1 Tax=viral metagenome TaxID=1070528 RepID=A0A6C0BZD4_9ZZZZ